MLNRLQEADPSLEITPLSEVHLFTTADKTAPSLPCSRKVKADVRLRIRHGTQLLMRHMEWLVSDLDMYYVLIGRKVLAALGMDNKKLLQAACDHHGGIVDVPGLLYKQRERAERTAPPNPKEANASQVRFVC